MLLSMLVHSLPYISAISLPCRTTFRNIILLYICLLPSCYFQEPGEPSGSNDSAQWECIASKYCSEDLETQEADIHMVRPDFFDQSPPYCSCDLNCHDYSDCCVDRFVPREQREGGGRRSPISPKLLECRGRVGFMQAYLMVSHCPDRMKNELVRGLCEKSNLQITVPDSLTLPVSSLTTNRTYGNIYCGTCNGELYSDLVPWGIEYTCENMAMTAKVDCYTWSFEPLEFSLELHGVSCAAEITNLTRFCPAAYSGVLLDNCTHGPSHYVFSEGDDSAFKNQYCALCNGVTHFYCLDRRVSYGNPVVPVTSFSVLATVAGKCINIDGLSVPCPESQGGFCPPGKYPVQSTGLCQSICSADEVFTQLLGCTVANCTQVSEDEYEAVRSADSEHYDSGYLRSNYNDTLQYCYKCATIPHDIADSKGITGFIIADLASENNGSICSEKFLELNRQQLTEVNSTGYIGYENLQGQRFILQESAILKGRNRVFLEEKVGKVCQFQHIPNEAVVAVSNRSVLVREYQDSGIYFHPFFKVHNDTSVEICHRPVQSSVDCKYELMENDGYVSKPVHLSNDIVIVEETPGTTRIYHKEYFKADGPDTIFVCRVEPYTWLTEYESLINLVCYVLSVLGLIVVVIVYSYVKSLRNLPGIVIVNESLAYIAAYVCFAFLKSAQESSHDVCYAVGVLTHYFFLSSFIFAVIYALILARSLTAVSASLSQGNQAKIVTSICGWMCGALLVSVFIVIDKYSPENGPMYARPACFVNNTFSSLQNFFYAPLLSMMLITAMALGTIIRKLLKSHLRLKKMGQSGSKDGTERLTILVIAVKLQLCFGLLWVLAVIAFFTQHIVAISLFTIINSLQGFLLFVVFVCNGRVFRKTNTQLSTASMNSTKIRDRSMSCH